MADRAIAAAVAILVALEGGLVLWGSTDRDGLTRGLWYRDGAFFRLLTEGEGEPFAAPVPAEELRAWIARSHSAPAGSYTHDEMARFAAAAREHLARTG